MLMGELAPGDGLALMLMGERLDGQYGIIFTSI